jgi:hypothetical protein
MSSEPSPAESQARSGRDVLKGRDDGRRRELRIAARRERPRSQPPAPGSQGTGPPQGRRLGGHCPCFVRQQSSCVPASGDFRMALSVGVGSAPADPFGRAPRRQVGSPPVLSTTSSTRIGRAPFVDRSMNADVSMRESFRRTARRAARLRHQIATPVTLSEATTNPTAEIRMRPGRPRIRPECSGN